MRLRGTLTRSGKWWEVEIPLLEAYTQGRTKREAYEMAVDWVTNYTGDIGARVVPTGTTTFEFTADDHAALIALVLRCQREAAGLSLAEVAERLGAKSRNAYARYEQGKATPTLEVLERLFKAVSGADLVIGKSDAA